MDIAHCNKKQEPQNKPKNRPPCNTATLGSVGSDAYSDARLRKELHINKKWCGAIVFRRCKRWR